MNHHKTIRVLYKSLLSLYPRSFRTRFAESMEQTFNDQYKDIQKNGQNKFGLLLWMFIDTFMGVFREHQLLLSPGDRMKNMLKTIGASMFVSFLLTLPLIIMEVVNRRQFNEELPLALFSGIWFILFAINLILLPIVQGGWAGYRGPADPIPAQESTLPISPKFSAAISLGIILSILAFSLLNSLGVISTDRFVNGLYAEKFYVFGIPVLSRLMMLVLASLPIAAGIIAGGPIVHTLRKGGSLLAHPVNLIVVAFILLVLVLGLTGFIIDQWPCFMGVQFCD